jgi:peptidoglycan/xylan/chitin deacetylase (PgdA/CDA1 family)
LEENITIPEKSIVITLDDGWKNQYVNAYPILKQFGYTATFFIFSDAIDTPHFFSWDQVRVMNNSGMSIGGHTKSHPYLPSITDSDVLRKEIISSKHIIEDQIGTKINLFAYPFGHYNDQIISIVKEAGYKLARSTYKGVYNSKSDLYTLKGIEVTDDFNKFVSDINK